VAELPGLSRPDGERVIQARTVQRLSGLAEGHDALLIGTTSPTLGTAAPGRGRRIDLAVARLEQARRSSRRWSLKCAR